MIRERLKSRGCKRYRQNVGDLYGTKTPHVFQCPCSASSTYVSIYICTSLRAAFVCIIVIVHRVHCVHRACASAVCELRGFKSRAASDPWRIGVATDQTLARTIRPLAAISPFDPSETSLNLYGHYRRVCSGFYAQCLGEERRHLKRQRRLIVRQCATNPGTKANTHAVVLPF